MTTPEEGFSDSMVNVYEGVVIKDNIGYPVAEPVVVHDNNAGFVVLFSVTHALSAASKLVVPYTVPFKIPGGVLYE